MVNSLSLTSTELISLLSRTIFNSSISHSSDTFDSTLNIFSEMQDYIQTKIFAILLLLPKIICLIHSIYTHYNFAFAMLLCYI